MDLTYEKFSKKNSKLLINFLSSQVWSFHTDANLSKKEIEKKIKGGYYTKKDQVTFLVKNKYNLVGFFRVFGLKNIDNETPLFDIRIASKFRKKGIGSAVVKFMLHYVFKNYNLIRKVEGTTREDNMGMQKVFQKVGFTKVAQFRKDWKGKDGVWHDTIGYDILKEEFEH